MQSRLHLGKRLAKMFDLQPLRTLTLTSVEDERVRK